MVSQIEEGKNVVRVKDKIICLIQEADKKWLAAKIVLTAKKRLNSSQVNKQAGTGNPY